MNCATAGIVLIMEDLLHSMWSAEEHGDHCESNGSVAASAGLVMSGGGEKSRLTLVVDLETNLCTA